ncbi:hypothetical protein M011DRAFT_491409 [Sporormia fimetaria CBS 119925]|uniref:Uncharacterized protein n=1 Tax=Sporormia fimetaria CBS 119925 TaxID=1340428 RepID=A0A6A6VMU6_9PLEO|nr:hypothetical protein M011DRAFT_491409 [Sporormia fimetaria CBS 119925]
MSFSRGFSSFLHQNAFRLPSSLRVAFCSARSHPTPARLSQVLRTPLFRQYARPSHVVLRGTPARTGSSQEYFLRDSVMRAVVNTKHPAVLYRAPDRRLYMLGVYGLAFSLVAGGLWTLRFRYQLPEGLPFFVGPTYVVVAFLMLGIAGYIFSAPVARCTSIELIPSTISRTPVQLRIKVRSLPFLNDQVIIADLNQVSVAEKLNPVTLELLEADRARHQSLSEGLENYGLINYGWEVSARWIEQKWTSFFLRFKFAVLRFGIVKLKVNDEKWKVDCSGFLLEDGQAIDRLVVVE